MPIYGDYEIIEHLALPLLYFTSEITLQPDIYWDALANPSNYIDQFSWEIDGQQVNKRLIDKYPIRLGVPVKNIVGQKLLSRQDWINLQNYFNGQQGYKPELWRVILAEAYREAWKSTDMRNVVLKCATALEVGIQPLLPRGYKFSMDVFRGRPYNGSTIRTPSLEASPIEENKKLYKSVKELWFTRHGIIHRGDSRIYDKNPIQPDVSPTNEIITNDRLIEFLSAVPRAIDFIVNNPP
ncbi:MAG: hypothetical protein HC890_03005 [Chloroflexaceae bacterium]|nr:hypothetical protein [Chloroflexaceae bacterium]